MTLFDILKSRCADDWQDYTQHQFVETLGEGTLPLPVFQDYLVQDFHFLVQFARAYALATYKSRTLEEIAAAHKGVEAVLTETELHLRLTERWGVSREELNAAPVKMATVAYTRYVLDCGASGDLLDLYVALAPCTIGYGEIGTYLEPKRVAAGPQGHPYDEWISEYSGEGMAEAAREAIEQLDALVGDQLSERRLDELTEIFRTATRLEVAFWQQALDSAA